MKRRRVREAERGQREREREREGDEQTGHAACNGATGTDRQGKVGGRQDT